MVTTATGFDPKRSQVADDQLQNFLKAPITGNLEEVPGIGPATAKQLQAAGEQSQGINTTYQLMGQYLLMREPGMSSADHSNKFWEYLKEKGVTSHRSGIVTCVGEKTNMMFPGFFEHMEVDGADAAATKKTTEEKDAPQQPTN